LTKSRLLLELKDKDKKMKASDIFLPFWKLMGWLFVYCLFIEGLKKLGLVKSK